MQTRGGERKMARNAVEGLAFGVPALKFIGICEMSLAMATQLLVAEKGRRIVDQFLFSVTILFFSRYERSGTRDGRWGERGGCNHENQMKRRK